MGNKNSVDRRIILEEPTAYDPEEIKRKAALPPLIVTAFDDSQRLAPPPTDQLYTDGQGGETMRAPRASYRIDEFDLESHLGDGSYSEVILAKHKDFPDGIALKIMSKQLLAREKKIAAAKRERNILDRMNHPGITSLLFTFQDSHSLYLGLSPMPGGELYDQIRLKGAMAEDEVRMYAADIIDILGYLRHERVIFRDLKPENLLISASGHLCLCDFGSATELPAPTAPDAPPLQRAASGLAAGPSGRDDGGDASTPSSSKGGRRGTFVGTADYIPPESLERGELTFAWDLWSFGCIVYQMFVGTPPFRAETEYLTFLRIKEGQFLSPPNASPAALDLLNKLFVADPSKRLGAASLEEIQSHPFFQGVEWSRVRHGPAPDPVPLSRRPVDALWKMKMGIGGGSGRYGGQPAANVTYVVNDGQAAGELESGAAGERPVAVEGSPSPPQGRAPVALALQIQAALEGLRLGVQAAPDHEGPESEGPSLAPEARAPALA